MPKVFFSWQSDHPSNQCRGFIRAALDSAAESLNSSVAEADRAEIVSDTQGMAGSPDIFNSICQQIDQCDVFVSDLTIVAEIKVDDVRKILPNPNVSIEYGYALKSKGRQSIIAVMNEVYFEPKIEELPFNLRHARGPYRYRVGNEVEANERKKTAKKLEQFFIQAIGSVLKLVPSKSIEQGFTGQPALENDLSTFLKTGEVITRDGDSAGQTLNVVLGANLGNIYARLIPKRNLTMKMSEIRRNIIGAPGLSVSSRNSSGSYGNNQFGYVDYAFESNSLTATRTVVDFVQFFKTGEVWCINGSALNFDNDIWEGSLFSIINKMLEVIQSWLSKQQLDTDYSLVVGVTGLRDKRVAYGLSGFQRSGQFYIDHLDAKFDNPKQISTQMVKDVLWNKIESEF